MMPEKDAYDIARKRGMCEDERQEDKDDGGDRDDERDVLGSIRGELSVKWPS